MGALKNFNSQCRTFIINASTFMLFIFVIVVLLQVLTRNILKIALDWTSEVSLLCFVWSVFLGAACAVSERKHYVVDLFPPHYVKINMALVLLSDVLIMGVIFVMIFGGFKFAVLGWNILMTSLEIPRFWLFFALPLSGFFMFLFNLENTVVDLKTFVAECKGAR